MTDHAEKPNWLKRHKVLTVLIALILLGFIVAAANGGGNNSPTVTTTSNKTSSNSPSTSSLSDGSNATSTTAKIGDAINIGGSKGLAVTLVKIIDPATGADEFTTPDAGKRFVAIDVQIKNNGTSSYQDDANSDVTIIGTDNQSYNFDPSNVGECTNFNDGQYTLAAGETETGCVVFQLPDGINAAKVQFQIQSGLSSNTGEWVAQ